MTPSERLGEHLRVAGLFAGVGGIEVGLHKAGHVSSLLCEIDPGARRVLESRFPNARIESDVRLLKGLPRVDVLAAGFPCQDLSQAGRTAGIAGTQSSLVEHIFRLVDSSPRAPRWLLIENVSFMLQLDRGEAMRYLVEQLESRRFAWAYRVVDTRAFGLPQRRQRVILIASRTDDPRQVLFGEDHGEQVHKPIQKSQYGFYWTEGNRGLGWAVDELPTLKGGSTIGIPSPPAIWDPLGDTVTTPDIRDAERLQGLDVDWTLAALEAEGVRRGHRWKLVGNAVSVPVAEWVGRRLASPLKSEPLSDKLLSRGVLWPRAAWGQRGKVFAVDMSMWPLKSRRPRLSKFLRFPRAQLSARAAAGFLSRARLSRLSFEDGFLDAVERHVARVRSAEEVGRTVH